MIPRYSTILYATDLSENAAHAFRHAISVARCHDARIRILHVLPEVDSAVLNYVSIAMGEEKLADLEVGHKSAVKEIIRQRLHDFARDELGEHPADVDRVIGVEVHHGSPVAEILKAADRHDVDLVVVGSHGKGRLKYAFLGSVAEKLLRKSQRPVLVVPLGE